MSTPAIHFNAEAIRKDEAGRINLTDIWKSADSPYQKRPAAWFNTETAVKYIGATAKRLKVATNDLLTTRVGRGGGSFADKLIALEYARYLSPKLAVLVNESFFERIEEEKNPELIVERAVRGFRRKGLSDAQISARIQGVQARNKLTEVCGKHGVRDAGFRDVTNAIYMPLLGGTAADVRKSLGLPAKANLRDSMSVIELRTVEPAELVSAENIQEKRVFGAQACVDECYKAAAEIGGALVRSRR